MTLRSNLAAAALALTTLTSSAVAATLPIAQAEHSGTFFCSWPNLNRSATFVLDIQQSSLMVDMGSYQVAGFFQVAANERATIYALADGNQSGKIAFTKDGQIRSGTGSCERKD